MPLLTGLQSMMAYWETQQAVNAVQIAELTDGVSQTELQAAADRLFHKFLIAGPGGWPTLTGARIPAARVLVRFDELTDREGCSLDAVVTRLLNEPFSDDEPPFRVGLCRSHERQFVWLCYRHAIADARSIALLMQNLLEELVCQNCRELPLLVQRTEETLADLFRPDLRRLGWLGNLRQTVQTMWDLQRSHRRPPADPANFRMTFLAHAEQLPLAAIINRAKSLDATVGELLTAAMLEWFIAQDPPRSHYGRPTRCVSVLVDLTLRAIPRRSDLFGQFLSPHNHFARCHPKLSFENLVRQVVRSHRRLAIVPQCLRTLRGLGLNAQLVRTARKPVANWNQELLFPVSGSLSNVNLPAVLSASRVPLPVANYFRGTCATQFTPLMLCLTTVKDNCTLTTTHRDTVSVLSG